MFADDSNLFFSHKNLNTLYQTVTSELTKINTWFQANKLSLNINKTNYVLFHKKSMRLPSKLPTLVINNTQISRVECLKFLGIILDQHLDWGQHIACIEKKISTNIGVLYRASKYLNFNCLKNLYYSLIHSHINYGNLVWASCFKTKTVPAAPRSRRARR